MNDEHDESMHRIIRLKRYEQPPEGYYENFLEEFRYRQRAELLKPSLTALLKEHLSSFVAEFRVPAFAYAGAAAVAVLASVAILHEYPGSTPAAAPAAYVASYSQNPSVIPSVTKVPYSQTPITIRTMQPVSLRDIPSTGTSSELFPTSYLLQASPANHESPLSF